MSDVESRPRAAMTIDLEDYRRHEPERITGRPAAASSLEVARQTDQLLSLLGAERIRATFFSVGRLSTELPRTLWREIAARHRVGCHGHLHREVFRIGAAAFAQDVAQGKHALEDVTGVEVSSYRAPYFSADGCDPWFGEGLARAGYRLDSSRRLPRWPEPPGAASTLPGSEGAVREVPLWSVGLGQKRLTVIGGSYFRVLPLPAIERLLQQAHARGFLPMIYLHPYDIDPLAAPLRYPGMSRRAKLGDQVRRIGRGGTAAKLRALARRYSLRPIEDLLT